MINYKELFLERMFAELSYEERDKNYKVICSHEQFANEKDELQWFKEQYYHYYGFPTSDILNYKKKLFNLFDALVDIQLTEEEALDLKRLCQEEEDKLILRENNKINQFYHSYLDLFTKVSYSYSNFKLNLGRFSAENLDKYIKYDELKYQSNDLETYYFDTTSKLKSFFSDIIAGVSEHSDIEALMSFLNKKLLCVNNKEVLINKIVKATYEIRLRFNRFIITSDSTFEREEETPLFEHELNSAKEAKLINKIIKKESNITSIVITTEAGKLKIDSNYSNHNLFTKNELAQQLLMKFYNPIIVGKDSDTVDTLISFKKLKHAHLIRAITEVFVEFGLLEYHDKNEPLLYEQDSNGTRLNIILNTQIATLIYDIAVLMVGDLPRLKTIDPKEKVTIDKDETDAKRTYTKNRLETFVPPLKFKV